MAKYKMSVGAVEALRAILTLPWGRNMEDTYRGGKILAIGLPVSKVGTPLDDQLEVEFDGPDRDSIKAAIQYGMTKEAIQGSKYLYEIITAFEFVSLPKPETKPPTP